MIQGPFRFSGQVQLVAIFLVEVHVSDRRHGSFLFEDIPGLRGKLCTQMLDQIINALRIIVKCAASTGIFSGVVVSLVAVGQDQMKLQVAVGF